MSHFNAPNPFMNSETYIIAVDPGLSGGIAEGHPSNFYRVSPMPATEPDIVELLRTATLGHPVNFITIVIEKLPLFIPGAKASGASMAKLHRNAGIFYGAACALGIRVIEKDPLEWQKFFKLGGKKSAGGYTAWKNKLKAEAQRRYPALKVTHATADALLIYEWACHQPTL